MRADQDIRIHRIVNGKRLELAIEEYSAMQYGVYDDTDLECYRAMTMAEAIGWARGYLARAAEEK
jgi:hypothetical protein